MSLTLIPIPDIPEVRPGDDVAAIVGRAIEAAGLTLRSGDVVAVAQKIVSKAEGRFVNLATVTPDEEAVAVAGAVAKDPRLVTLILRESQTISRQRPGVLIVRHRLGFVSANAGIDRSNVPQDDGEWVLLLPEDPDASADALRTALADRFNLTAADRLGVVITDSHGRPHRLGTVGVAIGVAGIPALWDRRGEADRFGYILQHTDVGVADEIAAAAGLLMGQAAEGTPVILLRGLTLPDVEGRAGDLIRPVDKDLYR